MSVTATKSYPDARTAIEELVMRTAGSRARLTLAEPLDRDGFLAFCLANPKVAAELETDGTITLMSPLSLLSSEDELEPATDLKIWQRKTGLGRAYGSSAGFTLPDGSVRSPDAAWVSDARIAAVDPEEFAHFGRLVPDFVIEVRSGSDNLRPAKAKMSKVWMPAGVLLGWLIDPSKRRAYIYRAGGGAPDVVRDFTGTLDGEGVVPGFTFDLRVMRQ